mgnify:CR=1 FL=1
MLKACVLIFLLVISNVTIASWPERSRADVTPPEVTREQVEALFGQGLEHADRAESLFLLAIALESSSSIDNQWSNNIGIPWVVGESASYWALLLKQGDRRVEVLVNNALLLMFSQGSKPSRSIRKQGATVLLKQAADLGYWPAQAYLGERFIEELNQPNPPPNSAGLNRSSKFEQAFQYLSGCAKAGFAACHFKLGFWYASVGQVEAAEPMLKAGIEVIRRDRRYLSSQPVMMDAFDALEMLTQPTVFKTDAESRLYSVFKHTLQQLINQQEKTP